MTNHVIARPTRIDRSAKIVGSVALAASLTIVSFAFTMGRFVPDAGDPYHYGEIARGFVEHGFTKLTKRSASLYPEFIALIYRLGGDNLAIALMQSVFHTATCLLAFLLGKRVYNTRTGLIAGLLCAVHPMLLRYVSDLYMETALTLLSTLIVWCAARFHGRPTVPNGILLGAVGIIATLTKGVVLPYLAVFGAISFAWGLHQHQWKRISGVVAMFVTMALLIAPWTYRNYRVTSGRFVLLAPGASDAFLRGYIFTRTEFATLQKPPYTDAENESNAWFRRIARDAGTEWELDEVVDEMNNARVARQMVISRPFDTVRKFAVGLFTFWYEMTSLRNSLIPAVLALAGWILALIGLRHAHSNNQQPWLLLLPIVVMNVFVAVLTPLGRYSVPVLPCLMILAAHGIDTIWRRGNQQQA